MVSRLPITIRPAHQEIAVSYLARLAALHEMPAAELWQQVSLPKAKGSNTRRLDGDLLATVANQPRHQLDHAIIELRDPEADWLALRHEPQRGCWRCDASHPGGRCCTCSAITPTSAPATRSGSALPTRPTTRNRISPRCPRSSARSTGT